jgi:hypothetical protein
MMMASSSAKAGSKAASPVLADADQRRADRLVRPALRRRADARGGGDQQEARVLVAGVVQGIEAAGDERVVERADRHQPGAEEVVGEAERRRG